MCNDDANICVGSGDDEYDENSDEADEDDNEEYVGDTHISFSSVFIILSLKLEDILKLVSIARLVVARESNDRQFDNSSFLIKSLANFFIFFSLLFVSSINTGC